MFEYFSTNYPWNLAIMMALSGGAQMSEVDDACRPLVSVQSEGPRAQELWCQSWAKVAERLERMANEDAAAGRARSAGKKLKRASIYFFTAERMLKPRDARRASIYSRALAAFRRGVELTGERVEFMSLATPEGDLPSLYAPAQRDEPRPAVVMLDGMDGFKELCYLQGLRGELAVRGISLLIVDHFGVGEALRFGNLPARHDIEISASAAVDWLEQRSDVDSSRIAVLAPSLGGYYALRAAAREPRFACAVAWGAQWDYGEKTRLRLTGTGQPSLPDFVDALSWCFGVDSVEDLLEATARFTVRDIAPEITCPVLLVHGENDRQIPIGDAVKAYEALTNASERELRVLTLEEGGAEHCSIDNPSLALDYIAEWLTWHLEATPVTEDHSGPPQETPVAEGAPAPSRQQVQ